MFTFPLQPDQLYDGLILWWPLNELAATGTVADRSGNSYTGTVTGAVQGGAGQEGNSVDLDGVNDDVTLSTAAFFTEFNSLTEFTMAFWAAGVSFETFDAGFSIADTGTNDAITIYPYHDTGGMMGTDEAAVWWNGELILEATGSPAANGTFNHFCFVSRSSTDHELFINGSSVDTDATSKTIDAGTDVVSVGAYDGASEFFEGQVDDVRVYNRALSDAEVARLASLPLTV